MVFNVFRRPDGALVVIPSLFQPPVALEREGRLRAVGQATVELGLLTERVIEQIGLHGYAVADGVDEALLRSAVGRHSASRLRTHHFASVSATLS